MKKKNIQFLRILSCLGVLMTHIGQRFGVGRMPILGKLFEFGAEGVYMFFLISGYLAFVLMSRHTNESFSFKRYYIERAVRILPVYYFSIFFEFVFHGIILKDVPVDYSGLGWWRYILCLSQVIPTDTIFWSNLGATWTISCFLCFYLLVPLLYRIVTSLDRAMMAWVVGCLFSLMLGRYNYFAPITYLHYFILGIVIFYSIKENKTELCCVLLCVAIIFYELFIESRGSFFGGLLFGIILINTEHIPFTLKSRLLSKWIDILDEYSYSIYLVHALVIELIDFYKLQYEGEMWYIGAGMILVFLTPLLCIFVHKYIEINAFVLYRILKK